jgi:hypothetical protein
LVKDANRVAVEHADVVGIDWGGGGWRREKSEQEQGSK